MGVKVKLQKAGVNKLIDYLYNHPDDGLENIMGMLDKVAPANLFPVQRAAFNRAISSKNNWYQLLQKVTHLNPEPTKVALRAFINEAVLSAWPVQTQMRRDEQCNIPWAILLDPTSACNLHCTGCWAADYGHRLNLTYEEIDDIINQGTKLGIHIYIYTGGEPLVRKKDIIRLCEAHQDCAFLSFTNGTLIDEEFADEMVRVGNFIPSMSVEGFAEATDARRGEGTYEKVSHAMDLLRERRLAFGVSCCTTSANTDSIASEEFFDWLIDKGALFAWFFTYMPVGKGAPTDLMVSPEQRERMYHHIRDMRKKKPLFTMDFWNDGEFVGGCIAGGRRYLHINSNGDVEPCVFAHYSNYNIREHSLLECLKQPLFMEYYNNQPFNSNLLRPCPMLDNPGRLAMLVERSGAKPTDLVDAESAEDICNKCTPAAEAWAPVAQKLWDDPDDERAGQRHDGTSGLDITDFEKFDRIGRDWYTECAEGVSDFTTQTGVHVDNYNKFKEQKGFQELAAADGGLVEVVDE